MKDKTKVVIVTGSSGLIVTSLIHKIALLYRVVGLDNTG